MSTTTALGTQVVSAARDALSRAVRQAVQTLIPTLLVLAHGSVVGIDARSVLLLAVITVVISLLRSVMNLRAKPTDPVWMQITDRALAAAAGTTVGLMTVDGVTAAAHIDWQATLTAAIGSALLSVAMAYSNPPVIAGEVVGDVVDERIPGPVGGTTVYDPTTSPRLDLDADLPRRRDIR